MRIFKRTVSVLLCCVLLAAFAPPAYAEDILIEKAEATYAVPKAGDVFDFNAITVPNGANYMAKILGVIYLDGQNQVISVKSGDVADAGVTYYVSVRFEAKYGYTFDPDKTEYVVNGETVTDVIAASENIVRSVFTTDYEMPDDPAPSKPTFRDRVVQFFRDMRNRFLVVVFFIRHLFGNKM